MRRGRIVRWVAAAVVVMTTVAGCTGVPGSSGPQVVRTIGTGDLPQPSAPAPPAEASPRDIVSGFFAAMAASPDRLDAARAYLDDDAAQQWKGDTITIVRQGQVVVGDVNTENNTVTVAYQAIGGLTADGVYTPATSEGQGFSATQQVTYALAKNDNGQWRIHTRVPNGLYITDADFDARYTPKALYFLDAAGTRLVPDLRYSALPEPGLETFLLGQLVAGPRRQLQGAVTPFQPVPTGNQRLSVTPGSPTVVQVPGASGLDGPSKVRLAAQVAFTLRPTSFQSELQIQDGTQVLDVPGVGGTFDVGDFGDLAPVDDNDDVSATYLRGGGVVDATGKPVTGKVGSVEYALDSAVSDSDGGRTFVAGTTGPLGDDGGRRLLVGDASGLTDVGVPTGPLSQPAWAPVGTAADVDEVWVASGRQLYRYVPGQKGGAPTAVTVAGQNTLTAGTVISLAFSPEGTRLVLVIRSTDGASSQVWLASVIRNGPDVQLAAPEQVTPSGYQISDAGWRSETLLAAVGTSSNFPNGVYLQVFVDGSRLDPAATDGLPDRPRSFAVSPRSPAQWATVGTGSEFTVYSRSSPLAAWAPPNGGSSPVAGYAPSFST